jgi:hypothetical protein
MTDSGPTVRRISIGAFAIWLVLIAIQYDYVPGLRSAWGFHLLRSLPSWVGWLLAGAALLVTTEEMRRGLVGLARRAARSVGRLSATRRDLLLFVLALAALWLLRERHLFGVSKPLLLLLGADEPPARVLIGAELLLRASLRGAVQLGLPPAPTVQLVSCIFGAGAIVGLTRAARAIGTGPHSVLIPLLVFSGGLLRVCVGRVDLQPPVLAAASVALLLAVREIREGGRLRAAAIAVGVAAVLQPVCFFLFPGLLLVASLPHGAASAAARLRRAGSAAAWALAPVLAYALAISLVYSHPDQGIADTIASMAGFDGWIFPPSGRHLAYLANSGFALAPVAPALLLAFAFAAPRRLYAEPIAAYLAVSSASLLLGASLSHPGFGAFEWDKYAVTGVFLTFFAGHLLSGIRPDVVRGQLVAGLIGMQLLFVGLPLIYLGLDASSHAGALSGGAFSNWTPADGSPPADSDAPQP